MPASQHIALVALSPCEGYLPNTTLHTLLCPLFWDPAGGHHLLAWLQSHVVPGSWLCWDPVVRGLLHTSRSALVASCLRVHSDWGSCPRIPDGRASGAALLFTGIAADVLQLSQCPVYARARAALTVFRGRTFFPHDVYLRSKSHPGR